MAFRNLEVMTETLERVSNIDDPDSGAPLGPDFKVLTGSTGT